MKNATLPPSQFLDSREFAALLGVGAKTVERLAAAGKLPPAVAIGRLRKWHRQTVERWIVEQTTANAK